MSRLMVTSDLHLGHKNICKYREGFSSPEEHNEILFDNLATSINKRDTLYMLGDVAFDKYWLDKVSKIKCKHKKLICGNHDRDHHSMLELCSAFDSVDALLSKRNIWWSHAPIHPQEMRGRILNIHGHLHQNVVGSVHKVLKNGIYNPHTDKQLLEEIVNPDSNYFNVCVEHTNFKPISFAEIMERVAQ